MKISFSKKFIPYEIGDYIMVKGNSKDIFKIEEIRMIQYVLMEICVIEVHLSFDGMLMEQWVNSDNIEKRIT